MSPQELKLPGFLFLTIDGRIAHCSREACDYLNLEIPGKVSGQKMSSLLGISEKAFAGLAETIANDSLESEVSFTPKHGSRISMIGNPAYLRNKIIGWDLLIIYPQSELQSLNRSSSHTNNIKTYSQQIHFKLFTDAPGGSRSNGRELRALQQVFIQRSLAIYILLFRVAGPKIAASFELILSESAAMEGYSVQMKDGEFSVFSAEHFSIAAIRSLWTSLLPYAENAVTRKTIQWEIALLNSGLAPEVLDSLKNHRVDTR